MFKKFPLYLSRYSVIPAILYIIPVIFYLRDESFSQTWLLYLGNAFFLSYLFIFEFLFFRQQHNTSSPVNAGFAVTISGIIFSCIFIILAVAILAPALFQIGSSHETFSSKPPAFSQKTHFGIWFILFANATIGNFVAGSFSAVLSAALIKQNKLPGNNINT